MTFRASTAALLLGACSLTSLDDLSGGSASPGGDAGSRVQDPGAEAGVDGAPSDPAPTDAGPTSDVVGDDAPARMAAYRAAVVADGPFAYYRFDEDAGEEARDEMGTYPARYTNPAWVDGLLPGSRAARIGPGRYVQASGGPFRFKENSPFTIEAWMLVTSLADYGRIVSTEDPLSTGSRGYYLGSEENSGGGLVMQFYAPAGNIVRNFSWNGQIPRSTWTHLVVAYDGTTFRFWLDGNIEVVQNAAGAAPDLGTAAFGCRRRDSGSINCVDAAFDEMAFYGKALPADRVAAHYALGRR